MTAFAGFLALGNVDAVTDVFTEGAFANYARQPVTFDLDQRSMGGAIDTGGRTLRSSLGALFPAPATLDWPSFNAYAVYLALTGGSPQFSVPLGGQGGVYIRQTPRSFPVGSLVLRVVDGELISPLGGDVVTIAVPAIVGGALIFGNTGPSTTSPVSTSSPGGGASNSADHSDPNNAYLAALAA